MNILKYKLHFKMQLMFKFKMFQMLLAIKMKIKKEDFHKMIYYKIFKLLKEILYNFLIKKDFLH